MMEEAGPWDPLLSKSLGSRSLGTVSDFRSCKEVGADRTSG